MTNAAWVDGNESCCGGSDYYNITNVSGHTKEDGTTATFKVALKSAPSANVTVNVTSSNNSEGTVSPSSLTFTTNNWNTAQTVTVTGVDDSNSDGHKDYQINLSATPYQNDITDTLNSSAYTIFGGYSPSYEYVEKAFDGNIYTKNYNSSGSGTGIIINAGTNAIVTTLGLTTANDVDGRDPTSFSLYGSNNGSSWTSIVANTSLNPPNGRYTNYPDKSFSNSTAYQYYKLVFETVRSGSAVQVSEVRLGGTSNTNETAAVSLHNLDDDTDFAVGVSSSNTAEGTVSPSTITFTENNWNTPQTVTVTGVDDSNTDGHQDYDISLSATVSVDSSAINFDGVNDYVAVNGLSGKLSTGDDFTISTWFKTDYTPSARHKHILFSAHDSGSGNTFRVGTGVYGGIFLNHGGVDKEYGSGFNDNNWHFVSVVITGTGVPTVRVDGNIISGFPNGQTSWSSATRYSIGQEWDSSSASDFWNGFIDEVAIWKAALSSEEVTALYNSGNGLNASSNSGSYNNSANLIAYWQFNEGSGTVSHPTQGDPTLNGTLNGILSSNWSSDDGLHIPGSEKTQVGLHNLDDDTDFTVGVSSSNITEGTVSPSTITFTENNWNTPQTVTVTGVDDNDADGHQDYNISLSADGVAPADLSLHNLDDDPEDVTVGVSSSNTEEGIVSPENLTFTEDNWNTPQIVTVTGVDDTNTDGHQDYDIKLSANSGGIDFDKENPEVKTFAGSGGTGLVNGVGTAAQIRAPEGITSDGSYLYVGSGYGHKRIRKIDLSTAEVTIFDAKVNGSSLSHLGCDVNGVTSDSTKSHIYYSGCQQIWQLNIATGERKHIAGLGFGNTKDGTGYSPSNTAAQFNYPRGMTILNDKLYIMQSGRIRVIDISGGVGENEGVVETLSLTFSGYSFLPQFYYSYGGITTDGTYLYVADGQPRIHKIDLDTMTVTRFAGDGQQTGTADGQGSNARFTNLKRMTSDGNNIYVADGNRIRKINVST